MLVDIPDIGTIISVFIAFVLGIIAIVIYNKVKPFIKTEPDLLKSYMERLQYYENQLIDMKIRLDSAELLKETEELEVPIPKPKEVKVEKQEIISTQEEKPKERMHNMNFGNATDYVLRLITEKPMTSCDIQIIIGRTREHTSRMMKKLFEEGLVERNMQTKPFTYYITDKGKAKLGITKLTPQQ
ncbi:MAG: helix-turn-helix transcriptional regulator [Thaumarchaeota archaeon]|nr:helix-turn-helix transcriptional regulator [Nitrososphaerota archaeon]MBI3641778.1 helix-turn-helix transcriptional regulator [Nitrososphaerota archaeon]